MPKFDMGAAWDDSMTLLRSHTTLTGAIAAVFFFLPALAVSWFGPTPMEPADGATFEQMMATLRDSAQQAVPYQLLISVIAAVGGVGILRLWLSRSSTSVGDALVFALKLIPTMIGVQLLLGLALGLATLLLLMPGIAAAGSAIGALLLFVGICALIGVCAFFWGRIAVVSPIIADRTVFNPVAAIQESLRLTKGNGWRIFFFLFLVTVVIVVVAAILGGVIAAVAGTTEGVGRLLIGVVEGGVAAVGGLVSVAIAAATYRQLAIRGTGDVFA
ncbi:MAG: hypothetical protein HEQ22_08195 [Sphingopyxis sp.]|uniref:hypothetical protein n=1 Tax=Sphingopyxis sp. TaxID=1908224 RepID=UPI003D811508